MQLINALRQDQTLSPQPDPALPILTWDYTSAADAQAYVQQCGGDGDNLVWGGGSPPMTAERVAQFIAQGKQYFTYPSTCPSSGIEEAYCAIWRITLNRANTTLGCAVANCGSEDRWACRVGTGALPSGAPY